MSYNRFDHEQQIMRCWAIVEDLRELNVAVLEKDISRDEISNIVMGLASMYDLKFNTLWDHFENSIKDAS